MKKQKYTKYPISPRTISAAIYEYLKKRGIEVNRRRGVRNYHWVAGEPACDWVYVMVKND